MTTTLLHYFSKRTLLGLVPLPGNRKIEIPIDMPDFGFLFDQANQFKCTCCGWEGPDTKAKKHYLIVERIAEVELFCPKCKHYLGFISEPIVADVDSR